MTNSEYRREMGRNLPTGQYKLSEQRSTVKERKPEGPKPEFPGWLIPIILSAR